MLKGRHVKKVAKHLTIWYIASIVLVGLVGAYIGVWGNKTSISREPTTGFEAVSFVSESNDRLPLSGWFLPSTGDTVAVIVHGWGGNRSTFVNLAEFLQQRGVHVLTFDLRGGTGRNTYGHRESGDIAGAITWLKHNKNMSAEKVVLIGNSMGGAASIMYTASHQVGGLVLISAVYNIQHTKQYFAREYRLVFPALYAASVSVIERVALNIKPQNPTTLMSSIKSPLLILHGSDDQKALFSDMERATALLSDKTKVVVYTIAGGSHTAYFDDIMRQATLNNQVAEFITQLP